MPRIGDQILDIVVYLYHSVDEAKAGEKIDGSGFLVGVPSETIEETSTIYAVTNSHVVKKAGKSPVIRLNTRDG